MEHGKLTWTVSTVKAGVAQSAGPALQSHKEKGKEQRSEVQRGRSLSARTLLHVTGLCRNRGGERSGTELEELQRNKGGRWRERDYSHFRGLHPKLAVVPTRLLVGNHSGQQSVPHVAPALQGI